jgi:hypothetical protein
MNDADLDDDDGLYDRANARPVKLDVLVYVYVVESQ